MSATRADRVPSATASPRLVLTDLDGTLVDTVPDIAACMSRVLVELGLEPCSRDDVRLWVGDGAQMLVHRAIAAATECRAGEELERRALELFTERYASQTSSASHVYPGVVEGLDCMRAAGMTLACITNKPGRHSEKLLEDLNLRERFALVLGGDSLPRKKPDPLPIVHAIERLGMDRTQTVLVGDSLNDVRAARAAGIRVICVSYGYNYGEDIRDAGADAVIDSFAELPAMLGAGRDAAVPGTKHGQ